MLNEKLIRSGHEVTIGSGDRLVSFPQIFQPQNHCSVQGITNNTIPFFHKHGRKYAIPPTISGFFRTELVCVLKLKSRKREVTIDREPVLGESFKPFLQ